jgi:RecB family endonuclease NucS
MEPIRDALTQGLPFNDAEFHWVTQGVIYVTAKLLAGEKSEQKTEPITTSSENEEEVSATSSVLVEDYNTGFMPLEKHLEEYIMKNWDIIDFGEELTVYRDEDGTPAQQYVTDVGIIDILAKDTKGNFVVLELKRAESKYAVVGQILNYMSWVEENLTSDKEKVRGIIIVGKADNTLKYALRQVQDKVILKEYRIKMTFTDAE